MPHATSPIPSTYDSIVYVEHSLLSAIHHALNDMPSTAAQPALIWGSVLGTIAHYERLVDGPTHTTSALRTAFASGKQEAEANPHHKPISARVRANLHVALDCLRVAMIAREAAIAAGTAMADAINDRPLPN